MDAENIVYIKNMVCPRCIMVVRDELLKLEIETVDIQLGKAILKEKVSADKISKLNEALKKNGFELLNNSKSKLIERIKILLITGIRSGEFSDMKITISQYISDNLHLEYSYLSNLFSSVEGKSIERYLILQKIELIKELITYDELSIKQIADKLGYSSLQALSNQFKKEIGINPTDFKKQRKIETRRSISNL